MDKKELQEHLISITEPSPDPYLWALTHLMGFSLIQIREHLKLPLNGTRHPIPKYTRDLFRMFLIELSIELEKLKPIDPAMQSFNTARIKLIDRLTGQAYTKHHKIARFRLGPTSRDEPDPHL